MPLCSRIFIVRLPVTLPLAVIVARLASVALNIVVCLPACRILQVVVGTIVVVVSRTTVGRALAASAVVGRMRVRGMRHMKRCWLRSSHRIEGRATVYLASEIQRQV